MSLRSGEWPEPRVDTVPFCAEGIAPPVGSDFETAGAGWYSDATKRAPWDFPETNIEYVQSGRQALAAIAIHLKMRGHDRVIFPGHFCQSMTSPFIAAGFDVVPVPVTDSVRMDLERTWESIQESIETTVVFGMLFFGEEPSQSYVDFVRSLSLLGIPTIEDETHRVFRPGGVEAEFSFGSLRKLLPVADGAYIRHRNRANILSELATNNVGDLRWAAMDSKALGALNSFEAMQEANLALEAELAATRMSDRSISSLNSLDYAKLSKQRATNATAMYSVLEGSGVRILDRAWREIVPSHLVVRTTNATRLQKEMAAHRIYCPIHWSAPTTNLSKLKWRNDLVSVPIDHRYGPSDMERVALTLRKVWST